MLTDANPVPAAWLGRLLQTSDPLFPTGAYAHSGGLEELVRLGLVRDEATLTVHLTARVAPMQAAFELPFVRGARLAALGTDLDRLAQLDREFESRKPARESRTAGRALGRRRLAALRVVYPHAMLDAYAHAVATEAAPGQAAVVAGVQAAVLGLPEEAALLAHHYLAGSGPASAALKLLRIGQEGIQRALDRYLAGGPAAVAAALRIDPSEASWFDPVLDIAALRHEHADERLFIS